MPDDAHRSAAVSTRRMTFAQGLLEAQAIALEQDPSVYLMGLGAPDPKGIFGTTSGLLQRFGPERVQDMPLSENAMTGVAVGSAITGMRPILTHQRVDFALVAMEQMVNQAAKWFFMFGGQVPVPLTIRMIVGRGWGQGPQHSQSLQAWFAHVPGLKVVMPATPADAKGLLLSAIEDDNPVICLEHRWLYGLADEVPEGPYRVPLGKARLMHGGGGKAEVTLVGLSYMSLEALRAAEILAEQGIEAEVIDLRSVRPLDEATILDSVARTGRLVVADTAHVRFGAGAEVVSLVVEQAFDKLKAAPVRIGLPDFPTPTSKALSDSYYPRAPHLVAAALKLLGRPVDPELFAVPEGRNLDQPDSSFTGPF
ncbi:pyruvate dehydrogenase E1 component beta subunit [Tistlia consotensis]|uniref:Pyruvate dehydrogenase E1 component beta subunit n=1 Tax=Tistlia consotensis USBA 355 TaxID=560819 RepID=A0A1Y6B8W5_9PROT|nr:transketolase C-terminal domain-containing protein [Tistlia consotensis]SME99023.1 pyruvate dehydrogenase E1 component beta subunit [Tistlia consotensis USBA 355]SNR77492.1 pyruvate dehydrogenase E1 component beta subunit [Tistlia consotensis]